MRCELVRIGAEHLIGTREGWGKVGANWCSTLYGCTNRHLHQIAAVSCDPARHKRGGCWPATKFGGASIPLFFSVYAGLRQIGGRYPRAYPQSDAEVTP
jgi:hypothetical protein